MSGNSRPWPRTSTGSVYFVDESGNDRDARTLRNGIHPAGYEVEVLPTPPPPTDRPTIYVRAPCNFVPSKSTVSGAIAVISYCRHCDQPTAPAPRCIVMFMTTSRGFASNYPPLNVRLGPALRRQRRVSNQFSSFSRTIRTELLVEVGGWLTSSIHCQFTLLFISWLGYNMPLNLKVCLKIKPLNTSNTESTQGSPKQMDLEAET